MSVTRQHRGLQFTRASAPSLPTFLPNHICGVAAAPSGVAEAATNGTANVAASSPQLARALESPFASESSQETPPHAKRGRPKGPAKKSKTFNHAKTGPKAGSEGEIAKAAAPAAATLSARASKRNGGKHTAEDATPEPEVAANMQAAEEAAGGNDDTVEADGAVETTARLEMARKASTGDGSRLERPAADSDDTSLSNIAQGAMLRQLDSRQAESKQDAGVTNEGGTALNGTRVFNPGSTATKAPHRLSKVTGTSFHVHPTPYCKLQPMNGHLIGLLLRWRELLTTSRASSMSECMRQQVLSKKMCCKAGFSGVSALHSQWCMQLCAVHSCHCLPPAFFGVLFVAWPQPQPCQP